MKKVITFVLLLSIAAIVFAEGVSEIQMQLADEKAAISYDALIDLNEGTSTSESVTSSFNDDGNLQVTYKGKEPITIAVSGNLDGTLIVKSDKADYTLVLLDATIKGNTLPAIQLKSETTATIYLPYGTSSYVCDNKDNSKKGAVTSSGDVIIDGNGSLTLEVFKKHGLKLDGGLTVNGGNIFINGDEKAEGNMISADRFFVMNDGKLTINAKGNVHASESKGIKVNGIESEQASAYGYVEINGGVIDITSVGKAITAGWKLSEDATTDTTADDPYPAVYINGGEIYIVTTGIPYEYSDDESLSPEGIEAKDDLFINGGYIHAETTDDALNAGKRVVFNGGYTYVQSSDNDAIDSNGTIEINGGLVVALCTSSTIEQAFDCDNDLNFIFTGGTYFALGNGNNMPKGTSTSAYSIAYGNTTFRSGDSIAVLNENGDAIMGFILPAGCNSLGSIVFGSSDFEKDQVYTIARGAFPDTRSFENGFVYGNVDFIAGSEVSTFTLTDYTVSEGYIGMNLGGGAGGFGGFGGRGGQPGQMPQGGFGGFGDFQPGQMPDNMPMPPDGFNGQMPQGMPQGNPQGGFGNR